MIVINIIPETIMRIIELLEATSLSELMAKQDRVLSNPSNLVPLGTNIKTGKPNYMVNIDTRFVVVWKHGGVNLPFYFSTGDGGKENVPAQKWYPFFGISDDWFNKGHQHDIVKMYNSPIAKTVVSALNTHLPEPVKSQNTCLWRPVTTKNFDSILGVINKDMTPTSKSSDPKTIGAALKHGVEMFGGHFTEA